MKINTIQNTSFQKTLRATASLKKNNGSTEVCRIYLLNPNDDKGYFLNQERAPHWHKGTFINNMEYNLYANKFQPEKNIWVLENKKGECLGYITSKENKSNLFYQEEKPKCYEIAMLETAPKYRSNSSADDKYMHVGETLVAYITKKALLEGKKWVELNADFDAINFYKHCFFEGNQRDSCDMILKEENFSHLIKQNEKHNNSIINLIG